MIGKIQWILQNYYLKRQMEKIIPNIILNKEITSKYELK